MEVCKKQLFHLIDRMQHVEVNEEQIAPYINQIMTQLEYLDKTELLKRFVSLEFNRFLEYYRNAEDLNIPEKAKEERGGKQGKKSGEKVRLKLNAGEREGITPRRVLGIINDVTGDKSISIGSIEITNKFTFFDVYSDQMKQLLNAFSHHSKFTVVEAKGRKQIDNRQPNKHWSNNQRNETRSENRRERRHQRDGHETQHSDKPWRKGRERNYERGRKK
jgi:ATP-dependent RNA helicase DeaD